ncbi:hypothetical protein MNBD_GAMMA16-1061 [hydrothermal vent metagenome]|uniref:YhdP central domain-containing protein n=1 Tax=hydrothermal vent metagenome TaxID=652676 RepID=A0A3B0ZRX2_9ZZZZ
MRRRFNKACWSLAVVLIVVVAIVASLIRIIFPLIGDYRQDIEQWVYDAIEYPVNIGAMETRWAGFSPVLHLQDVHLLEKKNHQNLLSFESVYVGLDLWSSVKKGRIVPGKITLSGLNLVLAKEEDGRVSIAGQFFLHESKSGLLKAAFHKWFFSHGELSIEQANISWENKQQEHKPVMFTQLNLLMVTHKRRHQFTISGKMPDELGEEFTFLLDAHGNISDIKAWDMNGYLAIEKINFGSEVLSGFLPSLNNVSGVLGLHAWLDWQNGHLTHASVDVEVSDLFVQTQLQRSLVLGDAKGRLEWQANEKGWLLSSYSLQLNRAGDAPLDLEFVVQASDQGETFEIGIAHFPISLLSKLTILSDDVQEPLKDYIEAAKPQGAINESYIRFSVGAQGQPFKLNAQVQGLSLQPVKKTPGFSGLSFGVSIDDERLQLNVLTSNAIFKAPALFRSPIKLNKIEGALHVFRDEERNLIINTPQLDIINQDVRTRSRIELILPSEGATPIVDVKTTFFGEGEGENVALYYPVGILSPSLLNWLDNSILAAKVSSGSLTLKGPLSQFPFVNGEGTFDLRFIFDKGVLEFSPNWPKLEDIAAEIKFIGRSMFLNAVAARTLDSSLRNVNVEIKDFLAQDRAVTIVGEAHGLSSDGIRYILESPLNETLGDFFSSIEVDKKIDVSLDIQVPLNDLDESVRINGGVEFEGNTLVYGEGSVDVTNLHGLVGFSEDGIIAHALTARVMGQPATINIESETDPVNEKTVISIDATGTTQLNVLRQKLGFENINFIHGETDWAGRLRLVRAFDAAEGVTAELNIYSMLEGVNIDLPPPLGKSTEAQAELNVKLLFPDDVNRSLVVGYDDILTSELRLLSLPDRDEGLELIGGWLHLGEGEHPSIQEKGLRIYGQLPFLDFEKWQGVFNDTNNTQSKGDFGVAEINMTFSEVHIFGQQLRAMDVLARPKEKGWEVLFEGHNAAGRAFIPEISTESIVLDLNYYYLYSQEEDSTAGESDPRNGRPFSFESQAFFYDDLLLGKMTLNVVTTPSGLKMEQFSLLSEKTRIMGEGEWIIRGGKASSSFDLSVYSSDAGATLDMFGFPGTMEGGQATNRLRIHWEGAPGDFKLASFNGEIDLSVKKGRLLEVEPGAGRVFGLLSLYALPRRFRLDFSDFLGQGFSFDTLNGSFFVKKGQAHTTDFIMRGPSANVLAEGLVDFNLKEYDQRITVVPHVTASLPLAVGLLISPVAGLAAWIAEAVIRKPLSRFTKIMYKVDGPWVEPKVEKIKVVK